MPANLPAAQSRLTKLAETFLLDHLGMMAPLVIDEVFSLVTAAHPQSEQQMLSEFVINLRKALPSEHDSELLINSICARYEQG